MYNEEHPLEIAIAAFAAGLAFTIFIYAKMGAFNPNRQNISEILQGNHYEFIYDDSNKSK